MDAFANLPRNYYGAILADPPWHFTRYSEKASAKSRSKGRAPQDHYQTMTDAGIAALPVQDLAADDCVLFMWAVWPKMDVAFRVIDSWGFTYKTCAFSWMKADPYRLFADEQTPQMLMGYWTRSNTEACLLATRGRPRRIGADVRQGIIEPRREHSRKPDCVHDRIRRLVAGPYLELFSRQVRPGWDSWGNETDKFKSATPPTAEYEAMWQRPYEPEAAE